jgi:hypothetical protein
MASRIKQPIKINRQILVKVIYARALSLHEL